MTSPPELFAEYPRAVKNRTLEPSAVYELVTDRYAAHRPGVGSSEDDDSFEVIEGRPGDRSSTDREVGAVYALPPGGTLAVPTGLVFVRFGSGVNAAERKDDIERAGYEIARTVEYAPEAVWLRDRSGDIAKALNGISRLQKISGVENVEPQMLMRRTSR